jgi:hypothetical protein
MNEHPVTEQREGKTGHIFEAKKKVAGRKRGRHLKKAKKHLRNKTILR